MAGNLRPLDAEQKPRLSWQPQHAVGDYVSWTKADEDVPTGSVGKVVSKVPGRVGAREGYTGRLRIRWDHSGKEFDHLPWELKAAECKASIEPSQSMHAGKLRQLAQTQQQVRLLGHHKQGGAPGRSRSFRRRRELPGSMPLIKEMR